MSADAFVQTIRNTLSNDNALRNDAEKQFETAKTTQPAQLVEGLFGILLNMSLEQPLREQSAVLLRKCLEKVNDDGSLWIRLGEAPQTVVREKLLQLLEAEQTPQVRHKVADCVQSLGNQLINIEEGNGVNNPPEWPALMPSLMKVIMDMSKDAGLRADCLWTVKEMVVTIWSVLLVNGTQTLEVLRTCMSDAADGVCGNATSLLLDLLDSTNTKKDREPFKPLAPIVCQVLQRLANNQDPKHLNDVLQSFQADSEVVEFLARTELITVVCTIAKGHSDEGARKLAMEAIVTFFTAAPAIMVKDRNTVEQALELCVSFMMLLDDDVDGWSNNDDDDDEDSEAFVDSGKNALDRIAKAAQESEKSFPVILEILKPAIAKLFSTGNWKETVTGITILAQIAEYVDEEEVVTQMCGAIKTQLKASHPRVRHAAWGGIAQFSQDHKDFLIGAEWAQPLMAEFVDGISDPTDRVAERCMEAFQMFGEEAERDDMEPFVPQFMEKLARRLEGTKPALQRKAITFIAVIAGQVEDGFAQYYGQLMPFLKKIIEATLHKVEERVILGKCFECISLLAKSVGCAAFRTDAEQIMQAMIQATQVPNLPKDDPVKEYMLAASERICGVMKEEFLPLVPHILPGILEKFTLAPKEWDTNNLNEDDYQGEVNLMLSKGADGKVKIVLMQSSELEELQNALSCVHTFVTELKKAYSPFVEATAKALLPVFEFDMDEGIRDMGFETWGGLCQSAREAGQGAVATELVAEFMKRMLPKLEEDGSDPNFDVAAMRTRADGVSCCLKKGGSGILNGDQVKGIGNVALVAFDRSLGRRDKTDSEKAAALAAGKDAPDVEEDEDEEGFRISLGEILGALMEIQPDEFAAISLQQLLLLLEKMMQSGAKDRKLVLFIICDMVAHLGARVHAQWQQLMPVLLQDLMNTDPAMRQPACYGISVAAKDPNFAAMAQQAAEVLAKVITETRARSKKKSEKPAQAAADNALSALVNILQHHQASVAGASEQLWNVWFSGMPCQEDEEEGQKNNKILVQLLMTEAPLAVSNLPKLLALLVDAYKNDMADEETSKGIAQLCVKLGEEKLTQVGAGFTDKQKKKLTRIIREAGQAQ